MYDLDPTDHESSLQAALFFPSMYRPSSMPPPSPMTMFTKWVVITVYPTNHKSSHQAALFFMYRLSSTTTLSDNQPVIHALHTSHTSYGPTCVAPVPWMFTLQACIAPLIFQPLYCFYKWYWDHRLQAISFFLFVYLFCSHAMWL